MQAPVLQLETPPSGVTGLAWSGRLSVAGQQRDVLVQLGPDGVTDAELRSANSDARQALVLRRVGVLPLLMVMPHEGRLAWVYERVDGIALSWYCEQSVEMLPAPTATAVVARLAAVLEGTGEFGEQHPGPTAQTVWIDRAGRPSVMGFVGPDRAAGVMVAPGPAGSEAVVFRLGVLLAHLLGGVSPGRATSEAAHASYLRKVEVRALERASEQLSPVLVGLLRSMLAWDPAERPALGELAPALEACVVGDSATLLRRWADRTIELALRGEGRGSPDEPSLPGVVAEEFSGPMDDVTLPGVPDITEAVPREGPTGSVVEVTETANPAERRRPRARPPLSQPIPVSVGPPPEAIPKPVRLPAAFGGPEETLPKPAYVDVTDAGLDSEAGLGWPWWVWVVWAVVTASLLAAVAGLALFLLLW